MTPQGKKNLYFQATQKHMFNAAGTGVSPSDSPARRGRAALVDMQLQVALYIESMAAELRVLARGANLEGLAYFLEMTRIEASIQVEQKAGSLKD